MAPTDSQIGVLPPETQPPVPARDLVPGQAPSFLASAIVVDEIPQWAAWSAAEHAWLESKRRRSGGENTVRTYKIALTQFFAWSGARPWEVGPGHAQHWAVHLATEGKEETDPETGVTVRGPLSEATVSLKLAALSSFYDFVQRRYTFPGPDGKYATLWPADRANPFAVVERPKISPYGRAKYPTTDELQAMLSEINTACLTGKRDFALLYTLSTTCRRASEVLNMQWGDIQRLADGNYSFQYRYKGGDLRRAVLTRQAFQAICAYLVADDRPPETMQDEDYIFIPLYPNRIKRLRPDAEVDPNQPLSNHQANAILKKYARRCGVDLDKAHLHALRHAGARLRVEQMKDGGGVDYLELMQLLGHSSLSVTQIYSQNVLEDPEDPGGQAAADALMPKGPRRRRRTPIAQQPALEGLEVQ
jgi:site-specific recombinase XerD